MAGNTLTNQHSDINGTHDLLQDESLCEFIVTSEVFMTDIGQILGYHHSRPDVAGAVQPFRQRIR